MAAEEFNAGVLNDILKDAGWYEDDGRLYNSADNSLVPPDEARKFLQQQLGAIRGNGNKKPMQKSVLNARDGSTSNIAWRR